MAAKFFLVLCASALFVQSAVSQCGCGGYSAPSIGLASSGLGYGGCGAGLNNAGLGNIISASAASANGGGLPVTTSSSIAPSTISVVSNNNIEGALAVNGQLPVLAAVALDAQLPTCGSAGTSYSCGDNNVGISSQSLSAAGISASNSAGAGYGNIGLANAGGLRLGGSCGCGIY
ncbi:chorion class B protein L11-like [Pectinophora gossypiella]|uniref:chorion class B protein L11-like n=1 Tax=Pectinophora gossypiella TaxID=13191 RepID=UPI00214EA8EB|nr:chorion class B protein L11-like [Pectinophora gossypiella]